MAAITITQKQVAPMPEYKIMIVNGTSAADGDTITVSKLQKIEGCIGFSSTGIPGSYSFATNVITVNNGGALVWNFIVWGY